MGQHVGWFGLQTLWPTDVGHAEYLLVCPYVLNVFKKAIMKDMISTCFGMS